MSCLWCTPRALLAALIVAGMSLSPHVLLAQESDDPPYTHHLFETQIGVGPAAGPGGVGGLVHAQARFALWHTIGIGAYAGGLYTAGAGNKPLVTVPLIARATLSLPFWSSFEPTGSLGFGYMGFPTESESALGAQLALALTFPGRNFGIEMALLVSEDPTYSSDFGAWLSLSITRPFRRQP